jgi:hypothetical protein
MKNILLTVTLLALMIGVKAQDSTYVFQENGMIRVNNLESTPLFLTPSAVSFRLKGSNFVLKDGLTKQEYNIGEYSEIFKSDTSGFSTQNLAIDYLTTILNRVVSDVSVQDQYTDPIIVKFNRIDQSTVLAENTSVDSTYIIVDDPTGASAGEYIIIYNPDLARFSKFNILSVSTDTLFIDSPMDVNYPLGSFVDITTTNMAVDASGSIQTFGLRGTSPSPIGITLDVTRIIVHCQTSTAVDLSKFGDISGGLTNGLLLRKRDGRYFNIFNVKTNGELANLAYDFDAQTATNPAQGQDGFVCRLTFAGQNKMGVTIRLEPGEDIEFILSEDYSDLVVLEVIAEGHIVED